MAAADAAPARPGLGIIAGAGPVPRRLIQACRDAGRPLCVVAFEGQTDPETVEDVPHLWTRLGAAGEILDFLRAQQVGELVLAGPIKRPSLSEVRPDWRAARFFARIGKRAFSDDGLLGSIVRALEEEEGFRVVGLDQLLGGGPLRPGPLGRHRPDALAQADIRRGVEVARAVGRLDIGQAVVVQQGTVLGVEAIEGTDALLARCAGLALSGPGGVLVKLSKPQQERRVDLPTVGRDTVAGAASAGLRGLAVEARGTLIVDRAETVAAADAAGLFLVAVDSGDPDPAP
ncbi:MAG: UDP-2,3-diacylglucosamine diphosphatase LpxI [Tistlia sp.]|uniref:LpxI family protein n=1 Tax=Tistlia sp. TaxID=3057121 RepID=UPI0034A38CF0